VFVKNLVVDNEAKATYTDTSYSYICPNVLSTVCVSHKINDSRSSKYTRNWTVTEKPRDDQYYSGKIVNFWKFYSVA